MARSTPVHSGYTIVSGAGTGPNGDRIDVWVEYKVTAQSTENNTSTLSAYFYACLADGQSSSTYGGDGCNSTFSINGVSGTNLKSNGSYDFRTQTPVLMGTFDGTITHTEDGSKTVAVAGSFTTPSDYITGGSVSANVTLPTINRGIMWVNVGGTWKLALVYVNVSGTWKQALVYTNVSGTWKLCV